MSGPTASGKTAEKLANLRHWSRYTYHHELFGYQSCRFCKRYIGVGAGMVDGLWKYGVRHYACDACRDAILINAGLAKSGLYGTSKLSAAIIADGLAAVAKAGGE